MQRVLGLDRVHGHSHGDSREYGSRCQEDPLYLQHAIQQLSAIPAEYRLDEVLSQTAAFDRFPYAAQFFVQERCEHQFAVVIRDGQVPRHCVTYVYWLLISTDFPGATAMGRSVA